MQTECWLINKDGQKYWAGISIAAIYDDAGSLAGFSNITRDLTKRKLAEEAREQNARQLQAKNKELEQFVYVASHDLQSPLRTVLGVIIALTEDHADEVSEEAAEYIGYINDSVNRMLELIRHLLDYARLENELTRSTIDCNRILDTIPA